MEISTGLTPIDDPLEQAAKERPGQPLKVRVQPTVLRHESGRKSAHYGSWRNLHWTLSIANVAEARLFREALSAFFFVAEQQGIEVVRACLLDMIPKRPD